MAEEDSDSGGRSGRRQTGASSFGNAPARSGAESVPRCLSRWGSPSESILERSRTGTRRPRPRDQRRGLGGTPNRRRPVNGPCPCCHVASACLVVASACGPGPRRSVRYHDVARVRQWSIGGGGRARPGYSDNSARHEIRVGPQCSFPTSMTEAFAGETRGLKTRPSTAFGDCAIGAGAIEPSGRIADGRCVRAARVRVICVCARADVRRRSAGEARSLASGAGSATDSNEHVASRRNRFYPSTARYFINQQRVRLRSRLGRGVDSLEWVVHSC